jgi:hypothetical protein
MPSNVPPPTIQDHNAIPGTVDFLSNYLLELRCQLWVTEIACSTRYRWFYMDPKYMPHKSVRTCTQMCLNRNIYRAVLMSHILQLKFLTCPAFRQDLQAASGFTDHCVPDLFWGTGPPGTFGSNVFGLLLTTLRQSVCKL